MDYLINGLSDVGLKRDHNEDFFICDSELGAHIVCDGMGGHAAGEVASQMAASIIKEQLLAHKKILEGYSNNPTNNIREEIKSMLIKAVNLATQSIFEKAIKDEAKKGMGTTLAMMLICGRNAFVVHVGDSRVYLVRKNKVYQLTEDHSMVNEMLKQGIITKDQAKNHPKKNVITRALGITEAVQVDVLHIDLLPKDKYLICSDGLTEYARKRDIWEVFHKYSNERPAKEFIEMAKKGGGKDNITNITIEVNEDDNQTISNQTSNLAEKKIETLKTIALFKQLEFQQLMKIVEIVDVKIYNSGQMIIKEGELGEEMYIILQGECAVYKGQKKINRLSSGKYFGEMSLIDETPRSASVKAISKMKILTICKKKLFIKLQQDSDMSSKIFWFFLTTLNKRMREKEEELAQLKIS